MKKCLEFFLALVLAAASRPLQAQQDTAIKKHRIAVFVPLYLDSAFDHSGNYRYDKQFPKFLSPGLEFYEGVQLALDTLQYQHIALDVRIYDTRSVINPIANVLQSAGFDSTELIIGYVNAAELHQLAPFAAKHSIPFINTNFPNDGGITNNPYFVILNSTLKTHCEDIYKFLQRNYSTAPIFLLRKKGAQEERLKAYFDDAGKNTSSVPLKIKELVLENGFDAKTIASHLDSTKQSVCIVGSLDENFGKNICMQLASINTSYTTTIIGMPTWDAITDFTQPEYANQEIMYTTPFYTNQGDTLVRWVQQYFKNKYFSRPSDMVFRGYETIYHFSKLLQLHGGNLSGSLGEKRFIVFDDFDIQPVFLNKQTMVPDYLENRKLYFVKKVNGLVTAVY